MSKPSDPPPEVRALRERIIGLGERSLRKTYFGQLRLEADAHGRARALLDRAERERLLAEISRSEAETRAATETSRLKDAFLSTLSHEMKTPLSLIVGYAELMQEKYPGEPLLDGILDGARRLACHTDDMLTYSALQSGSLPLYRAEVCLKEIIEDARFSLEKEIRSKHQDLRVEIDPALPVLDGDPRRLAQALHALLENATRFTPPGGRIELSALRTGASIELVVKDSGIGMTERELSRIWEPFGQAKDADAERTGGLGLGLKIARSLIELHGGTMSLWSNTGQGTRVTAILPLAKASWPVAG